MKQTLFVSDLDGTLLNAESQVSERSAKILADLSSRGALISVATARTPATADHLLSKAGLRLPYIVMTGAAMWDPVKREYLNVHYIDRQLATDIENICRDNGINPFIYTLDNNHIIHTFHLGEMSRREASFADERSRLPLKRMHRNSPVAPHLSDRTILFFAIGQKDSILSVAELLKSNTNASVSAYPDIFNKECALLEVFAPGVSKAKALADLRMITGAEETVVFGDNLNDLPMMQAATRSVAVANAFQPVKDAATEVIEANTEDSVARYILRNISNEASELSLA